MLSETAARAEPRRQHGVKPIMSDLFDNPRRVVLLAVLVCGLVCAALLAAGQTDVFGLAGILARLAHVLAAMVWGGLIVFMNFLHIPAVEAASDAERAGFVKWYVAGLGRAFTLSARTVIFSGLLLLVISGYVLSQHIYGSAVFVPPVRALLQWSAVLGGLVMAALVEAGVRPAFRTLLDASAPPEAKAAARAKAKRIARINLFLLLPVTALMIIAAHG